MNQNMNPEYVPIPCFLFQSKICVLGGGGKQRTIECWELKIETHEMLKRTLFIRTATCELANLANSFLSNSPVQ